MAVADDHDQTAAAVERPSFGPHLGLKARRWYVIALLTVLPLAIVARGGDAEAFAVAAVACGIGLLLLTAYFVFTDPPTEEDPALSVNPHPRHGVLTWVPATNRRAAVYALAYGTTIATSLMLVGFDHGIAGWHGDGLDSARLISAQLLVIAATVLPLESLGILVARRWGVSPPTRPLAWFLIIGGAIGWVAGTLTRHAVALQLGPRLLEEAPAHLLEWIPPVGAGGMVLLLWVRHGTVSVWQARIDAAEKGRRLAEAQLAMLQAQVEPHFLYNTLASVQYLVRKDAFSADFLLTQLIRYLRSAMPKLRSSMSTLGQEFELADAYLQIARMRMGDRLTVSVELAESLHQTPFPPLVLQTLVENALKHGVEPKIGPVHITVQAARLEGRLEVVVEDDGVGLPRPGEAASTAGSGTGLANIRDRLQGIYDGHARLAVSQRSAGGVRSAVTVDLPATAGGAQAGTADPYPIAPSTQET